MDTAWLRAIFWLCLCAVVLFASLWIAEHLRESRTERALRIVTRVDIIELEFRARTQPELRNNPEFMQLLKDLKNASTP